MLSVLYDQTESECPGSTWATKQPPRQFWTSLRMTSWHWLVGGFLRHRSVVHIFFFWWQLAKLVSFQLCILWTMETGPNSVSSISQSETSGARIKGHPSCVCEASHTNIQCWNKKGPCCQRIKTGFLNRGEVNQFLQYNYGIRLAFDANSGPITYHLHDQSSSGPRVRRQMSQPVLTRNAVPPVPRCLVSLVVGWLFGWLSEGKSRMIQASLEIKHLQYQGSHLTQCAPQIPTEAAAALKQRNWLHIIKVYIPSSLIIGHIQPGLWCTGGDVFCLFGLRVTSIFKSWTLSVLASWSSAIMRIDLQLLVHIYIFFYINHIHLGNPEYAPKNISLTIYIVFE